MAATPRFKVYDAQGKYQAAVKDPEAGAALMGFYGAGATIRTEHTKASIVWTEGETDGTGGDGCGFDSWDTVAEVVWARVSERMRAVR